MMEPLLNCVTVAACSSVLGNLNLHPVYSKILIYCYVVTKQRFFASYRGILQMHFKRWKFFCDFRKREAENELATLV